MLFGCLETIGSIERYVRKRGLNGYRLSHHFGLSHYSSWRLGLLFPNWFEYILLIDSRHLCRFPVVVNLLLFLVRVIVIFVGCYICQLYLLYGFTYPL